MKILLVQPPPRKKRHESIITPPLGLCYLAGMLEKRKYDVEILDAFALQLSWSDFEKKVKESRADLIGIGGMTPVIDTTYKAVKICRKYCGYLVAGGVHTTVFIKEIFKQMPDIDLAVYGEGEATFLEAVENLNNNKSNKGVEGTADRDKINPPRKLIEDLDTIPFPTRHLLSNSLYRYILSKSDMVTTMVTSRGCPYQCAFCDKSIFGSRYRMRSADNVVEEIEEIVSKLGNVSIIFYDDFFTANKERVIKICQGILDKGLKVDWKCESRVDKADKEMLSWMKKAGCSMIAYGVESGNQAGLDYLKKNITAEQVKNAFNLTKRADIKTTAYFMLGIPVETYDDEVGTINFAKEIGADYAQFSILSPFPGTKIYDEAIEKGFYREVGASNPMDKNINRPVIISHYWDERKLNKILKKAYCAFYLRISYILRHALSIRNIYQAKKYFQECLNIVFWAFKK